MNYSKIIDELKLTVSSDFQSLELILMHLETLNHSLIPSSVWLECQLALVEGFTNAVRHAHKNLPSGVTIDIQLIIFDHRIELRIWDYGDPFNLEAFMAKLPSVPDNLSSGGRGLSILRQIADFISYTQIDHRNCLLIIKYYDQVIGNDV